MKKNNIFLMSASLLVIMISMTVFTASGSLLMQNITGHDFDEEYFALDVDFNSDPADYGNLPSSTVLIKDYIDPTNSKIVTDPTDDKDRQFFLSYTNTSGIETAYLALEKVEQDIVVSYDALGLEFTLGHANGTAPFQSLVQHYESYFHDIFVTNFFNAFIAYETSSNDPWLDSGDDMYLGYSMVESHLLDLISTGIGNAGWDPIDPYGWEAFYNQPAVSGSETTTSWGIEYSNMMVFWQELEASFPTPEGLPTGVAIEGVDGLITGQDLVAAALFDTMKFTYEMTETTTTVPDPTQDYNWSVTEAEITTKYDLGAISLLITRDSQSKLTELQTNIDGIDANNSFCIPSTVLTIGSVTIGTTTYVFTVTTPDLCFYKDTAARLRIDAAAMENYATGMGLTVVSSTNMFSVGYEVTFPDPVTGQEVSYPIVVGGEEVFDTSFTGKANYTLDRTIDGGLLSTHPIKVDTFYPSNSTYVQNIFTDYFEYEAKMMIHFLVFMAKQTSPLIANLDPSNPSDIQMDVDHSGYLTLLQMPEWSGYPIVQDPTFSAVAAVKSGGESETTGETEETTQTSSSGGILSQIPGFELLAVVAAVPIIALIKKKRK
ncbi:MAG: hypothetical protein ACTSP4_06610 [Candidatus Hodarchaeales archaeon]